LPAKSRSKIGAKKKKKKEAAFLLPASNGERGGGRFALPKKEESAGRKGKKGGEILAPLTVQERVLFYIGGGKKGVWERKLPQFISS